MNTPKNVFKQQLLTESRPLIGVWCALGTAPTVELLSRSRFDWMLLDMEHGPVDIGALRDQLMALNGSRTAGIVRAKWNDMVELKRILDVGVQTVMIPQIQNAQEARQAVSFTRYPPKGVRGISTSTRASSYGRAPDYLSRADDEMCVIVQVESRQALDNVAEIASVEGVDAVFLGPSDLAASLGHLGNPSHPDVQTAIESAIRTIRAAGKKSGIITAQDAVTRKMIDAGINFIAVGIDVGLLVQAADALAAKYV